MHRRLPRCGWTLILAAAYAACASDGGARDPTDALDASDPGAADLGGAADPDAATDPGSVADPGGPDDPGAAVDPGGPDLPDASEDTPTGPLLGTFRVEERTSIYAEQTNRGANAWGFFYAAPMPAYLTTAAQAGGCTLDLHDPDRCGLPGEGGCAWDQVCALDGTCVPWPKNASVGPMTLSGLKGVATQVMQPDYSAYYLAKFPYPPPADIFDASTEVSIAAPGEDLPAIDLSVRGVAALEVDEAAYHAVPLGVDDATFLWTAGDAGDRVRLTLTSVNECHGCPPLGRIVCDVPDTGSLVVPGTLLAALPRALASGVCVGIDCPQSTLERYHSVRAHLPQGDVELRVASVVGFDVDHPSPPADPDEPDLPPMDAAEDTAEDTAEDAAPEVAPDACGEPLPGKPLALLSPATGDRFLAGTPVTFTGTTACADATVTFLADGKYPLGSASATGGTFALSYAFNTPGPARRVLVSVAGACGCEGSVEVAFAVQPAASFVVEDRKDGNGNAFTVRRAYFPTADPAMDLAVVGSTSAKTVKAHAESALAAGADSATNGGYFGAGAGPVSYAKGHLGHENQTGNVKGPRACLAWNRTTREARVEVSMGREYLGASAWGASLFPSDSDVICAGPRLLEAGEDVFAAHYVSEHFETSGINPDAAYPRTAACVMADGGVLLVAAQSSSSKSRGFTIPELATWLRSIGCVDALNLDGGGSTASWNAGPPVSYDPGTEDRAVYNAVALLRP